MSLFDCIQDAMDDSDVQADKARGKEAQRLWKEAADRYERQGYSRHNAEALAGEDVKAHFRTKAGDDLHVALAKMASIRKIQKRVSSTDKISSVMTDSIDQMDMEARGLKRYFDGRMSAVLRENHQDILGRLKKPAQMANIVRALKGESVDDAVAKDLSDAIREVIEDARLMFNEAGGIIRKMDGYDLPHSHNPMAVRSMGKAGWVDYILNNNMLDWAKMENYATGRPFDTGAGVADDVKRGFLDEVWENIVYGKAAREAVYGRAQGSALFRRKAEARQLHFKTSDGWMKYNSDFGAGDAFKSLTTHMHSMARDISAMRNFGPNPQLGLDYQAQEVAKLVRDKGMSSSKGKFGIGHAKRMMQLYMGPTRPEGAAMEHSAAFFSTARHAMTSAFLDRAVIASISDLNSMRMTAKSAEMNPKNIMATYGATLRDMVKEGSMMTDDLMRHQWVMDTLADPGSAMARFQQEVPGAEWAERLSAASMKVQGLSQHTDAMKFAFQSEFWGKLAGQADRTLGKTDKEFRKILTDHGITDAEWDHFRAGQKYDAGNGATFLNPLYWFAASEKTSADLDTFLKFQSLIEKWQEVAVPTNSLYGKAFFDPVAFGLPPGHPMYELMKSAGMFKSFVATFTVNQIRMIQMQLNNAARALYVADLSAGATVMGGLALMVGEIVKGNDPEDIRPWENPEFWARAALKGGGFGIVGDIVAQGESSWGGGFGSYVAGPMPQALDDAWGISISNLAQMVRGEDTKFQEELVRLGRRYTPMAQTPVLGPAIDRLLFDSLHKIIDPDAPKALEKAARARHNRSGNESFWPIGSTSPDRLPNLGAIIGQ